MCISMRYLLHRNRVENLYSFIGYKSVYNLEIPVDMLIKTGLLARHGISSTAMIHEFELTNKGKNFFRETGDQLILLKPNTLEELKFYLEDPTRTISGKNDYLYYVSLFIPRIILNIYSLLFPARGF